MQATEAPFSPNPADPVFPAGTSGFQCHALAIGFLHFSDRWVRKEGERGVRTAVVSALALVALIAASPAAAQDDRLRSGPRVEFHGSLKWNMLGPDDMRLRVAEIGRAIEGALAARGLGDLGVVMHYLPLAADRPIGLYRFTAGLQPMVGPRYAIDPMPGAPAPEGRTLHVALSAAQVLSDYAYRDASSPPVQRMIERRCLGTIIVDGWGHRDGPFPYEHEYFPCADPRVEDQLRRMLSALGPVEFRAPPPVGVLNYLNHCLLPDPEAYAAFLVDDVAGLFDGTRQERPPGRPLAAFAPEIACEERWDPR